MSKLISKHLKGNYMQTSTGKVANFLLPEVEVTAESPTGDSWKDRNLYKAYKGRQYINEGRLRAKPLVLGLAGLTALPGITALAPAISATLNNPYVTSHTTKVHEFRHKLESRYPLNYWLRNHLDKAYRIFSTKEPRNVESRSLSEKTATNTELRANLYHKFRLLNGREPRDIREMDKFIDNLSKVEIRDALRNINGYGNDYVESILSRIESAKLEGLPKEAILDGVNAWVENIKQALKYVPVVSGVSLIPKNKNTQPSN